LSTIPLGSWGLLAIGDGALRDRLGGAWNALPDLRPEEHLPESLRPKFRALMADLGRRAILPGKRSPQANTQGSKSTRMVETIFDLYISLLGGM
jgi:hypothetical protein